MRTPETLVERSYPMMNASYYLSRCGHREHDEASKPPSALGARTWKEAYDVFYDAMGDGRTPQQFRNSMKNARDAFDIMFDNGRVGWMDKDGKQGSLSNSFRRVHEEWERRSDEELEAFVLALLRGMPLASHQDVPLPEARTEGGQKVFISVRYERDPGLRRQALAIHGLACMACGFEFEKAYGELGAGYAEVHHMIPLAEAATRRTDPGTDLAVLCANCHRMVHRRREVCLSLDELKQHLRRTASES